MFPDDVKQSNALKRKMNRGGGSSEKSSAAKSAPRAAAKKSSSSAGARGGGGRGGRGPRRVDDFGFDGGERPKDVDQRFFDGELNHVAGRLLCGGYHIFISFLTSILFCHSFDCPHRFH